MKKALSLSFLFFATTGLFFATIGLSLTAFGRADKTILDCRVIKVIDATVLEENLSVEEYPVVSIIATGAGREVDLGVSHYSTPDGDIIVQAATDPTYPENANSRKMWSIQPSGSSQVFAIIVDGKKGKLTVNRQGGNRLVATLACKI